MAFGMLSPIYIIYIVYQPQSTNNKSNLNDDTLL